MKKIITYDVTLFGDVCGIVADFTLYATSLNLLRALIKSYVDYFHFSGIGRVMVLAHTPTGDKLYFASSLKCNFVLDK